MTGERLFVRCVLTGICVIMSLLFFPALLILKVGEGVLLAANITKESIVQVWRAPGHPGLDR